MGYEFTEDEKAVLKKNIKPLGKNIESYDVFIESALQMLSGNGQLSYVLPEAVMNVKAHTDIRSINMKENSIKYLEFLGNAFDGVQCPCIILQLVHTGTQLSTVGMQICSSDKLTSIMTERNVSSENFSFLTSDEEYNILEKYIITQLQNILQAMLILH